MVVGRVSCAAVYTYYSAPNSDPPGRTMGRKINFEERPKKGPGRKARKQKDPVFDKNLLKGLLF